MGGGGERLIPTAVFMLTFISLTLLLLGGFNQMVTRADQNKGGKAPTSSESLLANELMLTLYLPSAQETNGTQLNGVNKFQNLANFELTGQTDVGCMIARNWTENFFVNFGGIYAGSYVATCLYRSSHADNPTYKPADFVIFWQTWMGGTLALERRYRYDIVTFSELAAVHDTYSGEVGLNLSLVNSHLRYWVTEMIEWSRNEDLGPNLEDYRLWNNDFNVTVSTGFNATYGSISASTLIGQLIGLKMPGVPQWIQVLILIPFSITVLLMAVIIVSYFIP